MTSSPQGVTQLLVAWSQGDAQALDQLIPLVYGELRRLAGHHLRRERPGHTLQATALVHEAYLRLVNQKQVHWQNRAHFLAVAAGLMRRLLVDHARGHRRDKRGGGATLLSLDEAAGLPEARDMDVVALDEALTRLTELDPQQSRIVELRFFGGLTVEEAAAVLGVSPDVVKYEWRLAKAWFLHEMDKGGRHDA